MNADEARKATVEATYSDEWPAARKDEDVRKAVACAMLKIDYVAVYNCTGVAHVTFDPSHDDLIARGEYYKFPDEIIEAACERLKGMGFTVDLQSYGATVSWKDADA